MLTNGLLQKTGQTNITVSDDTLLEIVAFADGAMLIVRLAFLSRPWILARRNALRFHFFIFPRRRSCLSCSTASLTCPLRRKREATFKAAEEPRWQSPEIEFPRVSPGRGNFPRRRAVPRKRTNRCVRVNSRGQLGAISIERAKRRATSGDITTRRYSTVSTVLQALTVGSRPDNSVTKGARVVSITS